MHLRRLWHHYLAWHHGIIKRMAVFILLFITFLAGFFVSQNISRKEIDRIISQKNECVLKAQSGATLTRTISDEDLNLYFQKRKMLESTVESRLFFSPRVTKTQAGKTEVDIQLAGGANMKADASDLVLKYTNNLHILEIKPGTAFPLYPRKAIREGVLTITGVAALSGGNLAYGESNKPFITIVVEKVGPPAQIGLLSVDKINTQIYLQGNSIFDASKTFNQIEL